MENTIIKTYTNGDVTIRWEPAKCIHSARCIKGLPEVFNTEKRPWITIDGSDTPNIIAQVGMCPSGALSHFMNDKAAVCNPDTNSICTIEAMTNGSLLIHGTITIKHMDGTEEEKHNVNAFCRCGASTKKPFCDGTHRKVGFQG